MRSLLIGVNHPHLPQFNEDAVKLYDGDMRAAYSNAGKFVEI